MRTDWPNVIKTSHKLILICAINFVSELMAVLVPMISILP